MHNEPGQFCIHKRKGGGRLIQRCFTCGNFKSEGEYGFCSLIGLPCDGFMHCASHSKIPGRRYLKPKKQDVESNKPAAIEYKSPFPKNFDFTKKKRLYMKRGTKMFVVDDFELLGSVFKISVDQALDCAKYGGSVKGYSFVNKILKRGVLVIKDDGKKTLYKNIELAAKYEQVSKKYMMDKIKDNEVDVLGRRFFREWYEEDEPYIERPVSKRKSK